MKRLLSLTLILLLVVGVFAGCSTPGSEQTAPPESTVPVEGQGTSAPTEQPTAPAEKPHITLWTTGSQNLSDLFTKAIEAYNARPESTAVVELQFIMSGTGETTLSDRMAAAYQTGQTNSGFDLIAENSTALQGYVDAAGSEDLFLKLDFSQIPNYANVLIKSAFDNEKVVPYRGTTVVFAYDTERVPNPPTTWAELTQWIKDNPGRFAYNVPSTGGSGGGFVSTVVYKDLPAEAKTSNDEAWMAQWEAGFNWLTEIHPYLYQSGGSVVYPNKNQGTLDLLINKEVDMIPAWADQVLTNIASGTLPATTAMMQLSDASLNGTDVVFAIPSIGANAEACYDFINFMISPEGQKICLETIYAVPVIDPAAIDSDVVEKVLGLDVSKFSVISLGDLGSKLNEKWDAEIGTMK
jgi:putative spermidine/putrescine transport system substrate-binding protein